MKYTVAAEATKERHRTGLRPGYVAHVDQFSVEPAGVLHALADGASAALCGMAVGDLHVFPDWPFGGTAPRLRCTRCQGLLEA